MSSANFFLLKLVHPFMVPPTRVSSFLIVAGLAERLAEASDRPESQELGGGSVGGQEGLQEVKF